jgi:hypothetical protein
MINAIEKQVIEEAGRVTEGTSHITQHVIDQMTPSDDSLSLSFSLSLFSDSSPPTPKITSLIPHTYQHTL